MKSNFVDPIYGDSPSTWSLVTLGQMIDEKMADLQTGPFGTMLHASSYRPIGTPVVAVLHIADNRLTHDDLPRVDDDTAQRLSRYRLLENDILFGRKGAVDRRALVKAGEAGWLQGSDCIRLRFLSDDISAQFISYVLGTSAYKDWVIRHAGGATMPSLNQEILRLMPLPWPPLAEQRAIARILGALDDKIELNHRMNRTLEALAQALFKSWFVDFDPVTAKAEGRAPYGMSAETAALFPAEFVDADDNDFPLIPKAWKLSSLAEIANYENGLALQKYRPEGAEFLPVIKIRELRQGNADGSSEQASPNIKSSCILDDGDMVFSWSGSLMIDLWCGGKGALNQHLFKVTSEKYPKWFYYFWTIYHLSDFQNIAEGKATTMGHIQRHHLTSAKVIIPPEDVLLKANKLIEPMLDLIIKNRVQSRTLASIRDALLPRLLSGELRLKQADRIVE